MDITVRNYPFHPTSTQWQMAETAKTRIEQLLAAKGTGSVLESDLVK